MSGKSYTFQVGQFECTALLDGASVLGAAGMMRRFPHGTESDYREAYREIGLALDDADSSMNILAVKTGTDIVLVDAGEGGANSQIADSLRHADIEPEAITLVVITHAHGDHVQGLLSADGQPVYPNATYVMSKTEREIWEQRINTDRPAQRAIASMMERQGLRLIDMDERIAEGITAVPIPGHTMGQIAVLFESDGEKLIHFADMLHSPMQFAHPEWSPTFDTDTSISVPTRRTMLQRAADENWLSMFYHLTFPGVGRVQRSENGCIWQPVQP